MAVGLAILKGHAGLVTERPQRDCRSRMDLAKVRIIFCPMDLSGLLGIYHTGLAIVSQATSKCLRAAGIWSTVEPVKSAAGIEEAVALRSPTHVVINALWLPTVDIARLCHKYPDISFAVLCHSNMAFLQVEMGAITLLREALDLADNTHNFYFAANSRAGARGVLDA